MDVEVYYKLTEIRKRWGERILGQICQDLLALSFVRIGCKPESISVHNIEGIDIVIDGNNFGKYVIEVKTTSNEAINLEDKDCDGLIRYQQIGYKPVLAILKIDLFKDWIFVGGKRLTQPCRLIVNSLYTFNEYEGVAQNINIAFNELVKSYGASIFDRGHVFLREKLREVRIRYSGE